MAHRQTFLILGASGDLTSRLLLPGLASLLDAGQTGDLLLVGSSVDEWSQEEWRDRVRNSLERSEGAGERSMALAASARYVQADVTDEEGVRSVLAAVEGQPIIYFALPPEVSITACEVLRKVGCPPETRLVLEKPFGRDAKSAEAFNRLLAEIVPESQVHRVDHFLGLSTVLNIFGLRFANRVFEPMMNSHHVESVEILWDEDLALEGRAGYYDRAGALVDMIQSHLLQVAAVLAMEPPPTTGEKDIRDGTARILRAASVWDDDPARFSRRARYSAGTIEGRELPAYADEEGVEPEKMTETFAEIVIGVDTWRWAGVPFRLRSGKAIGNPRKEAVINFRDPEQIPRGLVGAEGQNRLRIGLGFGSDTVRFDIAVNGPGDPKELDFATLEATLGAGYLSEYGEVLKTVLDGTPALSVRGDAAVDCWRIIDPVRQAWKTGEVPLLEYPAGSSGPEPWPESGLPGSQPGGS
ncbi:MAG: glucose-6-phosphate dehydrogenase [Solirubrobacterales bacterium]